LDDLKALEGENRIPLEIIIAPYAQPLLSAMPADSPEEDGHDEVIDLDELAPRKASLAGRGCEIGATLLRPAPDFSLPPLLCNSHSSP
jgi:hypothetical protein